MTEKPDYEKMWERLKDEIEECAEDERRELAEMGAGDGGFLWARIESALITFMAVLNSMGRIEAEAKGEHE